MIEGYNEMKKNIRAREPFAIFGGAMNPQTPRISNLDYLIATG